MKRDKRQVLIVSLTDALGGAEQLLLRLGEYYNEDSEVLIYGGRTNDQWVEAGLKIRYCNNSLSNFTKFLKESAYRITFSSHLLLNAFLGISRVVGILKTEYLVTRESTTVFGRFKGIKLLKYRLAYYFGYHKIDLLITQSDQMAETLISNAPYLHKRIKIKTIKNFFVFPVESDSVTPIDLTFPFLVSAGRLIEEKGFDTLIYAFKYLKNDFPDYKLVVLGEGHQRTSLEQLITSENLQDDVLLIGHVQNVYKYFRQAEVCVVSSRKEGFPNVLLQMMSQNGRVVSTLCAGGISDIVGVETCIPDDPTLLYKTIKKSFAEGSKEANIPVFVQQLKERSITNYISDINKSLQL